MKFNMPLLEAIDVSVAETLNQAVFMDAVRAENTPETDRSLSKAENHWVSLPIYSPIRGTLYMVFEPTLTQEMATVMFSGESNQVEVDATKVSDTLKEVVNVVAGRLMGLLCEENQVFELGQPDAWTGSRGLEKTKGFPRPVLFRVNESTSIWVIAQGLSEG